MGEKDRSQYRLFIKPPFFYGWIIVFISGLGVFFSSPGQTYTVSIYIDSFINDLGWSRSLVSTLYSLGSITAGLLLTFIGNIFDRFSTRKIAPLIAFLLGATCLWMGFAVNQFMLFFGFFLLRLLGVGLMLLWSSMLVSKWFDKKRGRALSLLSIGGVVGAAVSPVVNNWFIGNYGWRAGWQLWTIPIWFLMVPLSWLLIRDDPKDVGLVADGLINGKRPPAQKRRAENDTGTSVPSFTLAEARRTLTYWLLLFCIFVPAMINTGISFHIVSILGEGGLPPAVAATTLSMVAIMSLPSSLFAGYLYDRFKTRYILIFFFAFYIFTLFWLQNVDTLVKSMIFGLLNGIMVGFFNVTINIVGPNYFGLGYLGSIRGSIQTVLLFGAAAGPIPVGFAYDYFGGYTEVLWIILAFPALALIASCFTSIPSKKT